MRIFIADGSKVGWRRIGNLLERVRNAQILGGASDGSSCLDAVRRLKPDVLIFDIELPERNRIDLLEQLAKEQTSLEIIVITDAAYRYYRKRCLDSGVEFFFDKATEFFKIPIVIEQLIAATSQDLVNNA